MSHAYEVAALRILDHLHRAERELLQRPIVTFNGEAGTILDLALDSAHGLCFTFDPQTSINDLGRLGKVRRYYPVSTIKLLGPHT